MTSQEIFVGIDISKERLGVCISSEATVRSVSNDDAGMPRWWAWRL